MGPNFVTAAGAIVALLPLTDYDCMVASPKDMCGEDELRKSILPERCDFFFFELRMCSNVESLFLSCLGAGFLSFD